MTAEQWIGVLLLIVGLYFVICATAFPGFFLYKMKVAQAKAIFGEKTAHRFYLGLGVVMVLAGTLKTAGLF
jgi:hypothetical protein